MFGLFWITVLFEMAECIFITTPGNSSRIRLSSYGITAENRFSLIFRVKACGSAHIFLSDLDILPTLTREFIFGNKNNTKCEFGDNIYTKFSYACSNACDSFDDYWISWYYDTYNTVQEWKMGRGIVVSKELIGNYPWPLTTFYPRYIDISSTDLPAEWEFEISPNSTTFDSETTQIPTTAEKSRDSTTTEPTTSTLPTELITESTTPLSTILTMTSSTASTQTTQSSKSTTDTFCYCSDKSCSSRNYTDEEIAQMIETMIQELKVSVKDTNAYKRRLISAPDDRPSAQRVGGVGAVVICLVILGIVLMDTPRVVNFFRYHDRKTEYLRKTQSKRKKSKK
ncbi:uncharacterized protein LOC133190057 [Saccostrea echinata]|uniref:uncharacterized protein LOC133190057 n=1 Tax=Saccostrea echinata TaxID=191078 RepID=UPI002A838E00|nr:uncharacterized protein LOC133190057 [Saccostrea echinata]